jgi:lactoylglutathione lyase/methylmalonyl-CoA/ethylmalonyl-CoA epimerase
MGINSLHHVGIIMPTIERAEGFMRLFSLKEDYHEYVPEYHAMCIFTKPESDTPLELVIPDSGVLQKYNNGKGGIHHIAFNVDDIEKTRLDFEAQGMQLLEREAVKGAGLIKVNFLHPKYGFGILVEFIEKIGNHSEFKLKNIDGK